MPQRAKKNEKMKNQKNMKRMKVLTYDNKGKRTNFSLVVEIERGKEASIETKKHYLSFCKDFFCKTIETIKIVTYIKSKTN